MKKINSISSHVRLAKKEDGRPSSGGRAGTVQATLEEFRSFFGEPHESYLPSEDEKVTAEWYFVTPRGMVAVYDYWWNPQGELSIGLRNGAWGDPRALIWFRRFLAERGFEASRSFTLPAFVTAS